MQLFHIVEDVQCITRCKGVYRQVPVYHRGVDVFARHGNGFIRLLGSGNTSHPNVRWVGLEDHASIKPDKGKLKSPLWAGD